MKKILILSFCLIISKINAQEEKKIDYGKLWGNFESNSQYYLDDKEQGVLKPENPFRSNSYLLLNYKIKKFSFGVQAEGYEKNALLNYNPKYKGTDLGLYFANYKNEMLDITAGHYFEQFGSGLLLRNWEDRALGINNALRGGRIKFKPFEWLQSTALYGKQRTGFDVSNGEIYGFDTNISLEKLLQFETTELNIGGSYVGRYEKTEIVNPNFDELTKAFAGRISLNHNSFYFSTEYNIKSNDAILGGNNVVLNEFVKPGNALLMNFGYSKSGLGIDATLRRMENMSFYSERNPELYAGNTSLDYNDKIMNFIPALTKQHHFNTANIYVYQSLAKVDITDPDPARQKLGEIGGQVDFFYNFKKGTKLGGKYGTKVSINLANWHNLKGETSYFPNPDIKTEFVGVGKKYFSDYNLEVFKKFSSKVQGNFAFIHQYYNPDLSKEIVSNIIAGDATVKLTDSKSIKMVAEKLISSDHNDWHSGTIEYFQNSKLSFYAMDLYGKNKGNQDKTHYYSIGGSYRKNSMRLALNYGRQRGGLVCVGGVCRFVPESKGISMSISKSF